MKEKTNSYRFIRPLLHIHLDDPYTYALLMFLCHAAKNDTGESWHGFSSIGYATGMGTRAIRSATKKLAELGLITAQLRGRQETKHYTVHHDALLALAEKSKAGRDAFFQAERQCAKAPSLGQSDRASKHQVTVLQSKSDSALAHQVTVLQSTPNLVRELGKKTREVKLDAIAPEISGTDESDKEKANAEPQSPQARINQAREMLGHWQDRLGEWQQANKPEWAQIAQTRITASQRRLDTLLAANPELSNPIADCAA